MPEPSEETLRAAAAEFAGQAADSELAPEVRFARSILRLISDRRLRWTGAPDPVRTSIFLLAPDVDPPAQFASVPFWTYKKAALTGRVWISNENAAYGHHHEYEGGDTDMVAAVTTLGLRAAPALVYDPESEGSELRFYPAGLDDPALMTERSLELADVTPEAIEARIQRLRDTVLYRPGLTGGRGSVWANAAQRHASSDAEASVQMHLQSALAFHFNDCEIRPEESDRHGRRDLTIEQFIESIGMWKSHCVLELKVLRGLNASGTAVSSTVNNKAITKGVLQAYKYREDAHADWSALYCFDLREPVHATDACFDFIRPRAAAWSVLLGHWTLFADADEARRATAA